MADRQLTADGAPAATNACKVVGIDATDGGALLSYAGLEPVGDVDPADWVASVFKGVQTDLHGYMTTLVEAAAELPAGARSAGVGHVFTAAGISNGQPVLYALVGEPHGALRLKRFERSGVFLLAGSGSAALRARDALAEEAREILEWIRRAETEEAHPREVSDRLAKWNFEASREVDEVGTHSIVVHRFVRDEEGAAGRAFYKGTQLEAPDAKIPHMTRGMDVNVIFDLMKKQAMGGSLSPREVVMLAAYKKGERQG